jgi:hypothetical protein
MKHVRQAHFRKCHSFWGVAPINHKGTTYVLYLKEGGWVRKNEGTPSKQGTKLIKQSPCLAAPALVKTLAFTESELTEHHSFVSLLQRKDKPTAGSPQRFSDVTVANIHQRVLQSRLLSLV